jgi:hypothetical protein
MQLKIHAEPLLLAWPNLSPGLISTADALVKSTDLIRPGVKLEITYTAQ